MREHPTEKKQTTDNYLSPWNVHREVTLAQSNQPVDTMSPPYARRIATPSITEEAPYQSDGVRMAMLRFFAAADQAGRVSSAEVFGWMAPKHPQNMPLTDFDARGVSAGMRLGELLLTHSGSRYNGIHPITRIATAGKVWYEASTISLTYVMEAGVIKLMPGSAITTADEVQIITISGGPSTGVWNARFNGSPYSTDLVIAETAANVDSAVEALATVGSGGVAVTGSNGGPYTVTYGGQLAAGARPFIETQNTFDAGSIAVTRIVRGIGAENAALIDWLSKYILWIEPTGLDSQITDWICAITPVM